jgi:hypothetical protein
MNQLASLPSLEQSAAPDVAYIGIDGADQKHDICLYDPATGEFEFSVIGSQSEEIAAWVEGLRKRFQGGAIAICTEQKRGPLIYALCQYVGVESLDAACCFQTKFCQGEGVVWQVETDNYFKADMNILSHQTVLVFSYLANVYWSGRAAPHTSPFWEVLLIPPVKILQKVEC